jgi:hypothetical protein
MLSSHLRLGLTSCLLLSVFFSDQNTIFIYHLSFCYMPRSPQPSSLTDHRGNFIFSFTCTLRSMNFFLSEFLIKICHELEMVLSQYRERRPRIRASFLLGTVFELRE